LQHPAKERKGRAADTYTAMPTTTDQTSTTDTKAASQPAQPDPAAVQKRAETFSGATHRKGEVRRRKTSTAADGDGAGQAQHEHEHHYQYAHQEEHQNANTECGRHGDEWLFGGHQIRDVWNWMFPPKK
jgi:ABC-type nickel/cobalt efflux system permease component RcnA